MTNRLLEFLRGLTETRGRKMYAPVSGDEPGLRSFQSEVDEIEDLAGQGLLRIIGKPHRESSSAHSYVDRIQVEVTGKGVDWINSLKPQADMPQDKHLTHLTKLYKAVGGNQHKTVLLSDVLRDEGLGEQEVWREADYMKGEGWVVIVTDEDPNVRLTHEGVKAAEQQVSSHADIKAVRGSQETAAAEMRTNPDGRSSIDIFISHSSQDEMVAEALADLFKNALNLSGKQIRCTSVPAYKLEPGATVEDTLRREIDETRVFIGLITPESVKSTYVLFELGARWGAGADRNLIPVLASGADYSFLHDPLKNRNPVRCELQAEVRDLIDSVASVLNVTPDKQSAYQKWVDDLVKKSKPRRKRRKNPNDNPSSTRKDKNDALIIDLLELRKEGDEILTRNSQNSSPPYNDSQAWATKVSDYLRAHLNEYHVRVFDSPPLVRYPAPHVSTNFVNSIHSRLVLIDEWIKELRAR
jgi:hypothetical protein